MKATNTIRNIVLASSLLMGFSLNAEAADSKTYQPEIIQVAPTDGVAPTLKLGSREMSYIQDSLNGRSRMKQASLWASLMDGEMVTIDGQLAVVWTRFDTSNGDHHLMLTNFGNQPISEQLRLYYLDEMDKTFPQVDAQPGETVAVEIFAYNYSGTDAFALYDGNGDFLANLEWGSRYIVIFVDVN